MNVRNWHIETLLIHGGEWHNTTRAVVPPIWQTSTYKAPDDADAFAELARSPNPKEFYSRYGNPTSAQVQEILAQLEGAEAAVLTASGMGAISSAVLAVVKAGGHIVSQTSLYAGTLTLFRDVLPALGIETTFVEQTDAQAFEQAIRPNTQLLYVETPANPLMKLTDLQAVATIAKSKGIFTLCDNTFATPLVQQPLQWGIDAVVHSATKFLGGHSDLTAGVVCGSKAFIEAVWKKTVILGCALSAFDAWLLLRGLRTLSLRVRQANETAAKLAAYLHSHPKVACVYHPSLPSHPQHALACKQMQGFTAMLSFELRGRSEQERFSKGTSGNWSDETCNECCKFGRRRVVSGAPSKYVERTVYARTAGRCRHSLRTGSRLSRSGARRRPSA
ncbi:MAG: aminotransferase class I/II-fold pyridoxal phosphate-dependent enzyme [Chloroherpetonaceae bacterium]|nr:aminotransferase class I/II-fold pyridoxal phosphate-dependent enzyme [Chloroherpetonaceae bacterium]